MGVSDMQVMRKVKRLGKVLAGVLVLSASTCFSLVQVSCGNHEALSCSGCPQGHGESWCHGDCHWVDGQCVPLNGVLDVDIPDCIDNNTTDGNFSASIDNATEVLIISGGVNSPDKEWFTELQHYSWKLENALNNVTAWHPLGLRCSIPSLPFYRTKHTMDNVWGNLTVCGEIWQYKFCYQLVDQEWVFMNNYAHIMWLKAPGLAKRDNIANMSTENDRYDHTSWVKDDKFILLGGTNEAQSAEIVQKKNSPLKEWSGQRVWYYLQTSSWGSNFKHGHDHEIQSACSITLANGSFVVTGGYYNVGYDVSPFATQFSEERGVIRAIDLTNLRTKRAEHACSRLVFRGQEAYIVVGGWGGRANGILDSSEIYLGGVWKTATPLPAPRYASTAALINGKVYVVGGFYNGEDGEEATDQIVAFDPSCETWNNEGPLKEDGSGKVGGHAMAVVPFGMVQQYCEED